MYISHISHICKYTILSFYLILLCSCIWILYYNRMEAMLAIQAYQIDLKGGGLNQCLKLPLVIMEDKW